MTPKEKLEEIKKDLLLVRPDNSFVNTSIVDCYEEFHNERCVPNIDWLIARVEQLELILKYYAQAEYYDGGYGYPDGEDAEIVLRKMP